MPMPRMRNYSPSHCRQYWIQWEQYFIPKLLHSNCRADSSWGPEVWWRISIERLRWMNWQLRRYGAMQGQCGTFSSKNTLWVERVNKTKDHIPMWLFLNMALCPNLKVVYPMTLCIALAIWQVRSYSRLELIWKGLGWDRFMTNSLPSSQGTGHGISYIAEWPLTGLLVLWLSKLPKLSWVWGDTSTWVHDR